MGGGDKTLIELGGTTIVARVLRALAAHCDTIVSVGREAPGGPAAAVASVRQHFDGADIVVVAAGDLALLRPEHVEALLAAIGTADAAAALDDRGLPNPLVAAHRASSLARTLAEVEPGDRADRMLPPNTIGVALDPDATFNVNTPDDLEEARRRLSR